ncbi:hypothetical protein GCM10027262_35190 [Nocardia tengchongensis]
MAAACAAGSKTSLDSTMSASMSISVLIVTAGSPYLIPAKGTGKTLNHRYIRQVPDRGHSPFLRDEMTYRSGTLSTRLIRAGLS